VAILVAVLVAHLAVTRHDIQPPADLQAGPPMRPQLAPDRSPRRGYGR